MFGGRGGAGLTLVLRKAVRGRSTACNLGLCSISRDGICTSLLFRARFDGRRDLSAKLDFGCSKCGRRCHLAGSTKRKLAGTLMGRSIPKTCVRCAFGLGSGLVLVNKLHKSRDDGCNFFMAPHTRVGCGPGRCIRFHLSTKGKCHAGRMLTRGGCLLTDDEGMGVTSRLGRRRT